MNTIRIYSEDIDIARALINRDVGVTINYYYKRCYPLFKSIFDNYYTDCKCCKEFMDEIYIVVLAPSKKTGRCQMENYRGESTLASWLKTACLYYCYNKYKLKKRIPIYEPLSHSFDQNDNENDVFSDRNKKEEFSNPIDFSGMNRSDIDTLLSLMPNENYRKLIELRYLEQRTNEETANELGVSMAIYYNMHHRAKEQYDDVCRKEEKNA